MGEQQTNRPTSTPPEAKVAAAQASLLGARATMMVHITEVVTLIGLFVVLAMGKLSETNFMILVGGALLGPAGAKLMGKPVVPTAIMVLGLLPGASAVARHLHLVGLVLLLSGCGTLADTAAQSAPVLAREAMRLGADMLMAQGRAQGQALSTDSLVCMVPTEDALETMQPAERQPPALAIMCMAWPPEL